MSGSQKHYKCVQRKTCSNTRPYEASWGGEGFWLSGSGGGGGAGTMSSFFCAARKSWIAFSICGLKMWLSFGSTTWEIILSTPASSIPDLGQRQKSHSASVRDLPCCPHRELSGAIMSTAISLTVVRMTAFLVAFTWEKHPTFCKENPDGSEPARVLAKWTTDMWLPNHLKSIVVRSCIRVACGMQIRTNKNMPSHKVEGGEGAHPLVRIGGWVREVTFLAGTREVEKGGLHPSLYRCQFLWPLPSLDIWELFSQDKNKHLQHMTKSFFENSVSKPKQWHCFKAVLDKESRESAVWLG